MCVVFTLKQRNKTLYIMPGLFLTSSDTDYYTGDGNSGIYVYGAQLEQASYPTSYIPTANRPGNEGGGCCHFNRRCADNAQCRGRNGARSDTGTVSGVAANILDSNGASLLGFASSDVLTDAITSSLSTANTANRIGGKDSAAVAWDAAGRTLVLDAGSAVTDAVAQTPSATLHLGSRAGQRISSMDMCRGLRFGTQSKRARKVP